MASSSGDVPDAAVAIWNGLPPQNWPIWRTALSLLLTASAASRTSCVFWSTASSEISDWINSRSDDSEFDARARVFMAHCYTLPRPQCTAARQFARQFFPDAGCPDRHPPRNVSAYAAGASTKALRVLRAFARGPSAERLISQTSRALSDLGVFENPQNAGRNRRSRGPPRQLARKARSSRVPKTPCAEPFQTVESCPEPPCRSRIAV